MANTITARQIITGAAKQLGAYFEGVLSVGTANPHTTLTVPKILDVAFDPERFQFWYARRRVIVPPLVSTITSATGLVTTLSAHNVAPGDTITFVGTGDVDYDNVEFVVYTTPTNTTFTITNGLGDYALATAFMHTVDQFRVVTDSGLPSAGTVTLNRAFQGGAAYDPLPAGHRIEFFLLLTPTEWFECLNSSIADAFYKDSISQTLTAGTTEYNLSTSNAWLQTKGQIIRARYRDASVAASPVEIEVPAIYFDEKNFSVTCRVPTLPSNVSNVTLEVDCRHYYSAFTSWDGTTTLPEALAVQKLVDAALKRIFQKLGPAAKRIFGMAMVVAEKDLAEAEGRWLDNSAMRDYSDEEFPSGGDPERGISWGW